MAIENQRMTFLSYSRINKDFAIRLAKELKAEGFYLWLDQLDIPAGVRWDREVEKALRECNIFMIILTPSSVDSENVLDEIGYAIDSGKRLLPVLLEKCDVPFRLRRFQYVDFTDKSFDDGVESAKDLLRELIYQTTVPREEVSTVIHSRTNGDQIVKQKVDTQAGAMVVNVEKEESKLPSHDGKEAPPITTVSQKKSVFKGLVIGFFILAVIVGVGFFVLGKYFNGESASDLPRISDIYLNKSQDGIDRIFRFTANDAYIYLHFDVENVSSNTELEIQIGRGDPFVMIAEYPYFYAGQSTSFYILDPTPLRANTGYFKIIISLNGRNLGEVEFVLQ